MIRAFLAQLEHFIMARSTSGFVAGVGTTFVALAVGFGGGLMMANSALKQPGGYQTRAASAALAPVRVVLPDSAEAAQLARYPQQQASSTSKPATQPQPATQPAIQSAKQVQALPEKPDIRPPKAEERERKRRYAERKTRRQAEARSQEQREQRPPGGREDASVMAFDGDSPPRFDAGMFGN
jgi:hypothetical protein